MGKFFKKLRSFLIPLLITLIILEIGFYVLLKKSVLLQDMPTYSFQNVGSNFWVEIDPVFGVWHDPHSSYLHKRACFDVDYRANSFGMRDPQRTLDSSSLRAVVLGDSFIEGFGIRDGKRISDLLEKQRGKEHLNFGTAGHFGPTQYYLLYKTLAKKFSHDEVIVGIYPKNDFTDDDYKVWEKSGRYRPFWVGEYPHYRLAYSALKPQGDEVTVSRRLKGLLREFTSTYTVFEYLYGLYKFKRHEISHKKGGSYFAGFYDFTEAGWNRMRYSLEKISEEAPGKKIIVVLIPSPQDIERYAKDGASPLSQKMGEWAQAHGTILADLLPRFAEHSDWKKYFNFPCDRHLSEEGNALAAQIIQSKTSSPPP